MKPAPFRYLAPTDLDDALGSLAEAGGAAKVLAGGQSLVPAMNFRLAVPEVLVDINRIDGFDEVAERDGELAIGMLVRHARFESPAVDDPLGRLLTRTSHLVGHLPIRVRGTFVGSLAHADPAAEWCAVALALDATIVARNAMGERAIAAADFFEGPFTTALREDEIVTEVRLPMIGRGGAAIVEKSHTAGDFATTAVVAVLRLDGDTVGDARIALAGVEGTPVRVPVAESALAGETPGFYAFRAAAHAAAAAVSPIGDALASEEYKRHLVEVLVERALQDAVEDAA
jgi:aerobic carbon-monoxide dehydrogenase medium subunit